MENTKREMEYQLFKTDSRDALLSLNMFFLKKKGIQVIYENKGDKIRGGNPYFEVMVEGFFLAFVFFIAINIKFPQNSAELHEALIEAATNPESVVTDLIENNKDGLLEAQKIIEDFEVHDVYKIKDNFEGTIDPIFKKNNKKEFMKGVITVAASAMKRLEPNIEDVYSSKAETVSGENNAKTLFPKRGKILEKYIEDYENAARATNEKGSSPKRNDFSKVASTVSAESAEMPGASEVQQKRLSPLAEKYLDAAKQLRRGGSKTRGQKRKIVESKRKRGGSKKQKRRSHKRR